jgi:hypothetical protein
MRARDAAPCCLLRMLCCATVACVRLVHARASAVCCQIAALSLLCVGGLSCCPGRLCVCVSRTAGLARRGLSVVSWHSQAHAVLSSSVSGSYAGACCFQRASACSCCSNAPRSCMLRCAGGRSVADWAVVVVRSTSCAPVACKPPHACACTRVLACAPIAVARLFPRAAASPALGSQAGCCVVDPESAQAAQPSQRASPQDTPREACPARTPCQRARCSRMLAGRRFVEARTACCVVLAIGGGFRAPVSVALHGRQPGTTGAHTAHADVVVVVLCTAQHNSVRVWQTRHAGQYVVGQCSDACQARTTAGPAQHEAACVRPPLRCAWLAE